MAALSVVLPFWWHLPLSRMLCKPELRRLVRPGLFNAQFYDDLQPGLRDAGVDPLQLYIHCGLAERWAV